MSASPLGGFGLFSAPVNTGDYYTSHGPTLADDVGFVNTGRDLPAEISY
jgi:hypothetical protein